MDTKKIREAVELLESMDPLSDSNVYDRIYELAAIIRAELDAAPKVKGLTAEPVAWMSDDGEPISARRHEDMEHAEHPLLVHYSTPLYLAPAAGLTMDGPLYDFKPDGTDVRLSVYPDHNHDGGFYLSWLQGEERWSTKLGWADVMECLANEYAPDDVAMRLQDQMKSARLTAAIEAKR